MDNVDQRPTEKTLEELEARISELENNWKRALADYQNLEKRAVEERNNYISFSNLVLISQLLPVLDNLETMERHLNDTGLKMIVKEFHRILQNEGVEEVEALGRKFDPLTMEAVETVEGEPNIVKEIEQKGYLLKGKLVRPARVKVGRTEEVNTDQVS
jgi:molecular chaperone GrpE